MSYRHPRWYDYGKTNEQLDRESNVLFWMLILAAPFTFGMTLIAAIVITISESWDSAGSSTSYYRETGNESGSYRSKG